MGPYHGRFVWYELMTTDMAASRAFYADVVGWTTRDVSAPGMDYYLFLAGDAPVAGLRTLPEGARAMGIAPYWLGYIRVDDVDVVASRFAQLGGAVQVPPTDIPGISRFSIVADPELAMLALVKGAKSVEEQPSQSAQIGHVGWHELLSVDREKAFAFYSAVLGWQKAEGGIDTRPNYQRFSAGDEIIGGMFNKLESLPISFWLYYFNVRDIDVAAKAVESGGGETFFGPVALTGGGRIAHCKDAQGASFGLLDRRRAVGFSTIAPL